MIRENERQMTSLPTGRILSMNVCEVGLLFSEVIKRLLYKIKLIPNKLRRLKQFFKDLSLHKRLPGGSITQSCFAKRIKRAAIS